MVSLWGSKKGNNEGEGSDNEGSRQSESRVVHHHHEPTERTRLLSPRPEGGYLHPDDPAVTPYNLWSVRFLRYFSVLFLAITLIWWVLLLVSTFVSPPMMHTRGSGFFDFSYTTLTAGNLLIALLFFATPSKAQRICCLAMAVLLLVDMIIILAVTRVRAEEGWVGISSVIWATLIAAWVVMTDRVVAWGKKEEEERLTGREERRKSAREWCSVFASTVLTAILIAVVVLLSATLILRSRDASLEAPGKKYSVDGNKYQVHLYCSRDVSENERGKTATVLLEGDANTVEYDLLPFIEDAQRHGIVKRYCYWDRPGLAWSDNAPSPLSAGMAADRLSEALASAGEKGPWVLVSAGVGGIYSRIFSSRHNEKVKGLVLIDTLHEDLLERIASPRRGFFLWGWGVISPLGLDRLFGALFKSRNREDRVWGRSAYQGGKFIKAKLQENLVANSLSRTEALSARQIQDHSVPLVVISSGRRCKHDQEWRNKQEDLTKITYNLVAWDVVDSAPHEVWTSDVGKKVMKKRLEQLI